MARDPQNQKWGAFYKKSFELLIFLDFGVFLWHLVFVCGAWHKEERSMLLELAVASTHFLTNSIAIADLYVHLRQFDRDDSCSFEPAKSTNCFLFSCVGTYCDLVIVAASDLDSALVPLGWTMVSVSAASAFVSVGCYMWGKGTIAICEEKGAQLPTLRSRRLRLT